MRPHNLVTYNLTITRHATRRFCQRAQVQNQRAAARHLTTAMDDAVQNETLIHCTRDLYGVSLDNDLVALCAITGPPQKPIAVVIITVLTSVMAITSFRHVARRVNPSLAAAQVRRAHSAGSQASPQSYPPLHRH